MERDQSRTSRGKQWLKNRYEQHRLKITIAGWILVFVLGMVVARIIWGGATTSQPEPKQKATPVASQGPTIWTCSMHPQIQQPKPGKCPICGMDLIPVQSGKTQRSGLRQLVVSPEARALMNIQTTPVQRRHVTAEVRMVGKVDYDETRFKYITAWVSGRLDRLFVDYTGVQVKKGDHMVYIYSEELYSAQEELIQALRFARPKKKPKQSTLLGELDYVEAAREKLRLLGLTEEQIAEIETRDKPSEHLTIYAPIGGIVIEKLRQEGDRVRTGDRIYTIADLTQVWVKLDAYESDLMWLRYGQKVTFQTESYPGETFEGRIAFIDPVLNDKTRTVKVRVNVPNEQGKLKPGMFVRAVVRARVATGGRVVDPELAGKWMCPMHPEVVRPEPGNCVRCGMPLVRAESLGFTVADLSERTAPLVIPVSAALVTGTRAIVYVEDPKAKEPTFEGREIVLGPRAGDYYIVRHGLKEGEIVVTRGNFKIDSEIQIRAQPSMMTPEGSLAGPPKKLVQLPVGFRRHLAGLVKAWHGLPNALQSEDLLQIRKVFEQAGEALEQLDPRGIEGDPKLVWKELAMLLSNDAFEGSQVKTMEDAKRVAASFQKHMERLDAYFRLDQQLKELPRQLQVPEAFRQQLARLWKAYLAIGDGLAGDDFSAAQQAAGQLGKALQAVDMKLLSDHQAHMAWMQEQRNLDKIIAEMTATKDIEELRRQFGALSGVMQVLAMQFGFGRQVTVYQLHCPMAFGGKGGIWLQADDQTRNPYFGSTMLECADRIERIAGGSRVEGRGTRAEGRESSGEG